MQRQAGKNSSEQVPTVVKYIDIHVRIEKHYCFDITIVSFRSDTPILLKKSS